MAALTLVDFIDEPLELRWLMNQDIRFNPEVFVAATPQVPGVYRMLNSQQKVIYVGKAKVLPKRFVSYFEGSSHRPDMEREICNMQTVFVMSDQEAHQLEYQIYLKYYLPYYNKTSPENSSYIYIEDVTDRSDDLAELEQAKRAKKASIRQKTLSGVDKFAQNQAGAKPAQTSYPAANLAANSAANLTVAAAPQLGKLEAEVSQEVEALLAKYELDSPEYVGRNISAETNLAASPTAAASSEVPASNQDIEFTRNFQVVQTRQLTAKAAQAASNWARDLAKSNPHYSFLEHADLELPIKINLPKISPEAKYRRDFVYGDARGLFIGPFTMTRAHKDILEEFQVEFGLPTCSTAKFNKYHKLKRGCEQADFGRCKAWCQQKTLRPYLEHFEGVKDLFLGKNTEAAKTLWQAHKDNMPVSAQFLNSRSRLDTLNLADNFDLLYLEKQDNLACMCVIEVSRGIIIDIRNVVLANAEDSTNLEALRAQLAELSRSDLYESFLVNYYNIVRKPEYIADSPVIDHHPDRIYILDSGFTPQMAKEYSALISEDFGYKVVLRSKFPYKQLRELAEFNTKHALEQRRGLLNPSRVKHINYKRALGPKASDFSMS